MYTHHFFRTFSLFHKALGNERRVYILFLLWKYGPMTGVQLVERFGIHSAAVSRHLHLLLNAGLILGQRKKMVVYFSINPTPEIIRLMKVIEKLTF